ncbi:MAG: hypothetical protein AAB695_02350 [Patescibacteria group bacterium]
MGKLEESSGKRAKKKNLQKIILQAIIVAGVLSTAMVVPNVLIALDRLGIIPNKRQKEYISSSASKLAKRGLLYFDGRMYRPTTEGERTLRRWVFSDFKLKKPRRWDGKWRVMVFDIPEKKRIIRNDLTALFRAADIYRLQDSVWIYPYDCEDIITLLKTDFGVGKYLLYMIVEELENDKYLRNWFDLV